MASQIRPWKSTCGDLKVLSERSRSSAAGLASELKIKIILYAEDSSQFYCGELQLSLIDTDKIYF